MGESSGSKERRSRVAEVLDATNDLATAATKWTPQQTITIVCIVLLSVLVAGFGVLLWINQEQARTRDRQIQDELAAQKRECNAQAELARTIQREENDKFRREVVAAIREAVAALKAK
jgi:Na+-transporting NADH:ubiquinone oxidoreductase subunit NqrC